MGSHRLVVAAWLAVSAASPTARIDVRPTPAPLEQVTVVRVETRARARAPKRPARPRIAVVAAGRGAWSLDEVPRIERAFRSAVGRALPISAYGQTALHEHLGFDHRDAVDVGLHPDSADGIALQRFLRDEGIPFIVARGSVEGVATGAHIHIGPPSPRLTALALSVP